MIIPIVLLTGCGGDHVLFVTDTSIGINVDSKPTTVSIAYDRIEGFVGPRYDSGAIPPVVGTLQTGGSVFNPRIRQFYATGKAALTATGSKDSPNLSTGTKKQAFFGTSTTLGVKAGFDSQSPVPDSFVFGYKRKEFSLIPVGQTTAADTYASTLASIDSNTTTAGAPAGAPAGANNTGLTSAQFFATGGAAEALAANPAVTFALNAAATNAAANSLTAEQQRKALELGRAVEMGRDAAIEKIGNSLRADANFVQDRNGVLANATPGLGMPTQTFYQSFTSKQALLNALYQDPASANQIAAGIR
jgi:hypothetical protein